MSQAVPSTLCPTPDLIILIRRVQDGSPQTLVSPAVNSWNSEPESFEFLVSKSAVIEFIIYLVIKGSALHSLRLGFSQSSPKLFSAVFSPKAQGTAHYSSFFLGHPVPGIVLLCRIMTRDVALLGDNILESALNSIASSCISFFSPLSSLITEQTLLVSLGSGRILSPGFSRGATLEEPPDLTFPSHPLLQHHRK